MSCFIIFDAKFRIMNFLYLLAIKLYLCGIYAVSPFNSKARLWITGRKNWKEKLSLKAENLNSPIWVHCASLGEFEQGRPVIEKIKEKRPEQKIILTFFSPSGYEIRKNYPLADYICYLPPDTRSNAKYFIETVRPKMGLFIKYEFWNNYISELYNNRIPVYLVSGIFRKSQHFFRWYGKFFLDILRKFTHFFLQDEDSAKLLRIKGIENLTVTGDTRFDRVSKIAASAPVIPVLEEFRNGEKIFLAGSSWPDDEKIIVKYINSYPDRMKWIFAPHEPEPSNIERLEKMLKPECVRFTEFSEKDRNARVLIINTVGILSSAYRYASIAAVGGGFGKGIHNVLEPACWGIPVLFGPNHRKFREAANLLNKKAAFCFRNYQEFRIIMEKLLTDTEMYKSASDAALKYISENTGATDKILSVILQNDINNFKV